MARSGIVGDLLRVQAVYILSRRHSIEDVPRAAQEPSPSRGSGRAGSACRQHWERMMDLIFDKIMAFGRKPSYSYSDPGTRGKIPKKLSRIVEEHLVPAVLS